MDDYTSMINLAVYLGIIGGVITIILLGATGWAIYSIATDSPLPRWTETLGSLAVGTVLALFAGTSVLVALIEEVGENLRWATDPGEFREEGE